MRTKYKSGIKKMFHIFNEIVKIISHNTKGVYSIEDIMVGIDTQAVKLRVEHCNVTYNRLISCVNLYIKHRDELLKLELDTLKTGALRCINHVVEARIDREIQNMLLGASEGVDDEKVT